MTGYDEGWTGSDDLVGFLVAVAFVEPLFPFFTRMLAEITPRVEYLAGVGLAHTPTRHLRRGGLGLSDSPDGSFKMRAVG